MGLTIIYPKAAETRIPMGWLTWVRDGDDFVSDQYRIRLIEPYRWEVIREGRHLFFDSRLSGALTRADHHHRDRLRVRDLITWSLVLMGAILVGVGVELAGDLLGLWIIPLLTLGVYGAVSAIVRLNAAASRC